MGFSLQPTSRPSVGRMDWIGHLSSFGSLQSLVKWDGEKLVCEQIGQKQNRGWAHWIEDGKLHLVGYVKKTLSKW